MYTQAKMFRMLGVCLSLLLMVAPLQTMQGQEVTESDVVVETTVETAVNDEGEASSDGQEASTEIDIANLPQRVFLPMIQGGNDDTGDVSAAGHTFPWSPDGCTGVTNADSDRGLWDDIPAGSGGAHSEAGLLWFRTNDSGDEACSYSSYITGGVSATSLSWRIAVNDNALFTLNLYARNAAGVCQTSPYITLPTTNTEDDSQYRGKSAGSFSASICRVQVILTDDPNSHSSAIHRTSALIDYIRLHNAAGTRVWQQEFSN